jgi:predicted F0F1-ATPase subunit
MSDLDPTPPRLPPPPQPKPPAAIDSHPEGCRCEGCRCAQRSEEVRTRVESHAQRVRTAQAEPAGSLWRSVAKVGSLGWLMALPPAGGALLGHHLDRRTGGGITWALGFLFLGLVASGYYLWREVREVNRP